MKVHVRPVFVCGVLCASLAWAGACSRATATSPTTPTPAGQQAQSTGGPSLTGASKQGVQTRALAGATASLLGGSFTVVNDKGDGIAGTYTGTVGFVDGVQRASLELDVTAGLGAFAGATGTLTVNGLGHFVDEGDFVLGGGGTLAQGSGPAAAVVLKLRGSSYASCSTTGIIAISQSADGTLARAGHVTATLGHEVGNAGCSQ